MKIWQRGISRSICQSSICSLQFTILLQFSWNRKSLVKSCLNLGGYVIKTSGFTEQKWDDEDSVRRVRIIIPYKLGVFPHLYRFTNIHIFSKSLKKICFKSMLRQDWWFTKAELIFHLFVVDSKSPYYEWSTESVKTTNK